MVVFNQSSEYLILNNVIHFTQNAFGIRTVLSMMIDFTFFDDIF